MKEASGSASFPSPSRTPTRESLLGGLAGSLCNACPRSGGGGRWREGREGECQNRAGYKSVRRDRALLSEEGRARSRSVAAVCLGNFPGKHEIN